MAVDATGSAVACQFTLGRAFGTGSMVSGFGTYLAAATPDPGLSLGPMIAINPNSEEFRLAIATSGGDAGMRAMMNVAAETLLADRPATEIFAAGAGDAANGSSGVVAARCVSGRPDIDRCVAAVDSRRAGLASVMADK